jgi:methylthioribose-1-phosphate isomerase
MAGHGVPHTLIVDNAGGHLMQHGLIDIVIVGTDRTTANGDVCNKIGTYLKALAAHDNGVPFYVGLPSPTIDWTVKDGVREIPIEERSGDEVSLVWGRDETGRTVQVRVSPDATPAANPAFDVTPARLVTGSSRNAGSSKPPRKHSGRGSRNEWNRNEWNRLESFDQPGPLPPFPVLAFSR